MRILRLVWDRDRDAPAESPAAIAGQALFATTDEGRRGVVTVDLELLGEAIAEHYAGDPEDDDEEEEKKKQDENEDQDDDEEEDDEEDDGLIALESHLCRACT